MRWAATPTLSAKRQARTATKQGKIVKTVRYNEPAHETAGTIYFGETVHAGPNDIVLSEESDGVWAIFIGEDGERNSWEEPAGETFEDAIETLRASGMMIVDNDMPGHQPLPLDAIASALDAEIEQNRSQP